MFAKFVVSISLLAATVLGAEWQTSGLRPVTTLVGVYATSESEVYGAVGDNFLGYGLMHSSNYGESGDFIGPAGSLNMDVAFTTQGTCAIAALGGVYLSSDLTTFTKGGGIHAVTQNVETFGTSSIGATGGFVVDPKQPSANGVAVSTDNGANWNLFDIGLNGTAYIARYAAFPSASTWYVSSGSWPYDETVKLDDTHKQLTKNIVASMDAKGQRSVTYKESAAGRNGAGGYPGAISKTTDAGKTWTKVFDTDGLMYFNEVHCADDNHCVASGEGDGVAGAYLTTDGGATWSLSVSAPAGASMVGAKMLSTTEAWVSGGAKERGVGLVGYYYHTTDGGKTWEQLKSNTGISFDLSFAGAVGYSAVISDNSCNIAVYR